MSESTKTLVAEMAAGAGIYGLLSAVAVTAVCLIGKFPLLSALLGLLVGLAAAIIMLIHMALITERVLDSGDAAYANRTTVIQAMIRKLVFIVLIFVVWRIPGVNVLTMILGTFGLKAGAYLQPQIHKAFHL